MNKSNPLLVTTAKITSDKTINKSGRPSNQNVIKFGPEPQSYISKLIKQIAVEKCNNSRTEKTTRDNDTISPKNDNKYEKKQRKSNSYHCEYQNCSYSCKLSCNMIKHKRTHSSEKQYLCDQCSFQTNFVNSLKVHKRIHNNEKPYNCKYCSYCCNSSSNLKKHCKHKHSKASSVEVVHIE